MLVGAAARTLHLAKSPPPSARVFKTRVDDVSEAFERISERKNISASATITIARNACSTRIRISAREGIDHDVHAKAGVVDSRETLRIRRIVPLGAVILAAVENGNAISLHYRLQVLVHQIVAPAIQLVTRRRRTVGELEERSIDLVIVGEILQRRERAGDLLERGVVKDAADIVVVVVDEQHSTPLYQSTHVPSLRLTEPQRQVTGQINQRIFEQCVGRQWHVDARRRDRDRCVSRDRVNQIRGQARRAVPVARIVLTGAEYKASHGPHAFPATSWAEKLRMGLTLFPRPTMARDRA